jgi:hypothetical protein
MPNSMSIGQYALHRGVTARAVRRWRVRGNLVLTNNGFVCVGQSDELLNSRPETNRGGRSSRRVFIERRRRLL